MVSPADVEGLRSGFSGMVALPGEPSYDEFRKVHNGLVDKRPAVIARCLGAADVRDAVRFAVDNGLEVSVRGGGHNVAGKAVTDGGVMVDLAWMRGTHVDPKARRVRAQGGVTWNEYNRAAAAFGLATTGGAISSTGIAGLTLGGGVGWLMAKYGMAVDNLVSAEMVLADGSIVTASDEEDADLFWAIRGGGGNFGVATSLEYDAHPLETVIGGVAAYPLPAALDVGTFYRDFSAGNSDDLETFLAFTHAPDGSGAKICAMAVCHSGADHAKAEGDVKPIRAFGPPIVDMIERMPYPVVNTLLDEAFPAGALNYWKACFVRELNDDVVRALAAALERTPTPMCAMVVEHFHGEVTRVDPAATAYPHRAPGYNVVIAGEWTEPSQTDAGIAWVRETFDSLVPNMDERCYVNYLADDEGSRVPAAYGANYKRLSQLKRRYDPQNVFRLNQNIEPA